MRTSLLNKAQYLLCVDSIQHVIQCITCEIVINITAIEILVICNKIMTVDCRCQSTLHCHINQSINTAIQVYLLSFVQTENYNYCVKITQLNLVQLLSQCNVTVALNNTSYFFHWPVKWKIISREEL